MLYLHRKPAQGLSESGTVWEDLSGYRQDKVLFFELK